MIPAHVEVVRNIKSAAANNSDRVNEKDALRQVTLNKIKVHLDYSYNACGVCGIDRVGLEDYSPFASTK